MVNPQFIFFSITWHVFEDGFICPRPHDYTRVFPDPLLESHARRHGPEKPQSQWTQEDAQEVRDAQCHAYILAKEGRFPRRDDFMLALKAELNRRFYEQREGTMGR